MTSTPARSWSRMASWVASSNISRSSVAPYSPALTLSSAVQNQPGKPWLPMTWVYSGGSVGGMATPFIWLTSDGGAPAPRRPAARTASKEMLLDLAHGGPRERVPELDRLRHLEFRETPGAPRDQLGAVAADALLQDDMGLDGLVAQRIGHGDDRGVEHGRMLLEDVLHLGGRDVLTGPLDHVLRAIDEEEVAFLVHPRLVAGVEPAGAQGRGRRLRVLEVALHQAQAGL